MTRQSAFTYLFWGFVFQLLNFYIQHINLFPDTVGYILIAVGANRLREDSDRFQTVLWLSIPLIFLSLTNIHQATSQASGFNVTIGGGNPVLVLAGLLSWFLALILVFQVCKGTQDIANHLKEWDVARRSWERWQMYLWLQIGVVLVVVLALIHAGMLAIVLGVALFIYTIIVVIAFLTWLWACRTKLG